MENKCVGFISGCWDLLHESHIFLLRSIRSQCDYLIVALTTDALMAKEKRVPILTFKHRKAILENLKFVDLVVANNGDKKSISWEKLQFNVLFAGEEYYKTAEFEDFKRECPVAVRTIFIPREPDCSSTSVITNLMQRFAESQKIVSTSIAGHITKYGFGPYHITKPIHFASRECTSTTSDIFGFYRHFDILPRNWKSEHHMDVQTSSEMVQHHDFPFISGIASNREININIALRHKPWCTYVSFTTVYEDKKKMIVSTEDEKFDTLLQFAEHVAKNRQFPAKVVHLIQKDGGITFETWCETVCTSYEAFRVKVDYIEQVIIAELEADGIIHSDVHCNNLLIHKDQVSLIDFGWVCAKSFDLCPKEKIALQSMLENHFDIVHFRKSMRICRATRNWLDMCNTVVIST